MLSNEKRKGGTEKPSTLSLKVLFSVSAGSRAPLMGVFIYFLKRKNVNCGKRCKVSAPVSPSCSYDVMGGGVNLWGDIGVSWGSAGRGYSDVNTVKRWHTAGWGLSLEKLVYTFTTTRVAAAAAVLIRSCFKHTTDCASLDLNFIKALLPL